MVHGEECQFPVDLFYAKHHDEMLMKNGFAEWLDEQFRDAHKLRRNTRDIPASTKNLLLEESSRETLGEWSRTRSGCGHRGRLSLLISRKDHIL